MIPASVKHDAQVSHQVRAVPSKSNETPATFPAVCHIPQTLLCFIWMDKQRAERKWKENSTWISKGFVHTV